MRNLQPQYALTLAFSSGIKENSVLLALMISELFFALIWTQYEV